MANEPIAGQNWLTRQIPWVVAGAAFLLYFLTLNPWVSSSSMPQVAKVSGLSWQTETTDPLYLVVSAPLRLLPARLVPAGVNLLSALCAALTLALLARSVRLLPHDRTRDQREREKSPGSLLSVGLAWLPPLFAAAVCGLELTFWQNGTNGTPEMVHLLFFAYAVRALLEFRYDGQDAWLYKGAFAMTALMTSNWLMVAFGPVYFGVLIWICGLDFFRARFLGRLVFCGLAGLSLYLLLPTLAAMSKIEPIGFWEALRMNLSGEKLMLTQVPKAFPKNVFLLLSLTSLLPLVIISIKWASHFGDTSQTGQVITKIIFHLVNVLMLLTCVWVMFDPRFSPRNVASGLTFLPLYWLGALCVGYFSGYFLLVFRPLAARGRRTNPLAKGLYKLSTAFVVLLAVAAPVLLFVVNHLEVYYHNQGHLRRLAERSTSHLPKSACLLSDDPRWSLLTKLWLARVGREKDFMVAETWALRSPSYHRYQRQVYGDRWPFAEQAKSKTNLSEEFMLECLNQLQQRGEVYYVHPSFGFFFEHYYAEPHGMVYRLKPYGATALLPPPLPASIIEENETFWDKVSQEEFPGIIAAIGENHPAPSESFRDKLRAALKLKEETRGEAFTAGMLYSRALNYWGVELQKSGKLERAGKLFELAQQINPANVAAKINLNFNRNYLAGKRERVAMPGTVEEVFGVGYRSWDAVLTANGPFDEQNLCYAQGRVLYRNGLYRQSAQMFSRVQAFAPHDAPSRLWLAQLNLMAKLPSRTIELTREMVEQPAEFDMSETNRIDALTLLARAHYQLNQPEEARALFEHTFRDSPTNAYLLLSAMGAYEGQGDFTNALVNVNRLLKLHPADPFGLLHKGFIFIQMNAYGDAVRAMTQLLEIETNRPEALLNRAIAYFRSDQLDAAKQDYEAVKQIWPNAYQVYYGLGEIALRQRNTNAAIAQYQAYLSNAIPNSAETKMIQARLTELLGAKPANP